MVPLCLRKARDNLIDILGQCGVLAEVIRKNVTILHDILKDAKRSAGTGFTRSFDTESAVIYKNILHEIETLRSSASEVRSNLEAFPAIMSESINMVLGKLSTDVTTAGQLLDSEGALVRIPMAPRSFLSSADPCPNLGISASSERSSSITLVTPAVEHDSNVVGRIENVSTETPGPAETASQAQASGHAASTVASNQEQPLVAEEGHSKGGVREQAVDICDELNAEAWRPVKGPWLERMSNLLRQFPPTAPQAEPPVTQDDLQSVYSSPGAAKQLRDRLGLWSGVVSNWAPASGENVAEATVGQSMHEMNLWRLMSTAIASRLLPANNAPKPLKLRNPMFSL